jgi:hypothetical protein
VAVIEVLLGFGEGGGLLFLGLLSVESLLLLAVLRSVRSYHLRIRTVVTGHIGLKYDVVRARERNIETVP